MKNSTLFILVIAFLISCIGITTIYSSNYQKDSLMLKTIYQRQMLWVLLGALLFIFMSNLNYRRLWDCNYFLYAAALSLLLLVFLSGAIHLGAQRWLQFAWFNFQPSEFVKIILVIFLSRYFSKKDAYDIVLPSRKFGILRGLIIPFIFVIIPIGLIIEQPDLGSGIMVLSFFIFFLCLSGIKSRYILIFLIILIMPLPIFWNMLRDYQKERLLVFLNPNIDPLGAGYTVINSKIAIGSGGIFGKGWLGGTQSQLHFLPEAHTDFIFATFAEQWGFLGSILLLILFFLLIYQGIIIAGRTRDDFGRLLAYGISLMLIVQVFVNIAMNLGLAPVVGIPLPLMSYGGSSIAVTFISLGILANIDKKRAVF